MCVSRVEQNLSLCLRITQYRHIGISEVQLHAVLIFSTIILV